MLKENLILFNSSTAEADAITSFIKGLEDDCEQNKCLSEEVDGNYESNYDDDDDNLDNNHCLPLFILLMKLNVEERYRDFKYLIHQMLLILLFIRFYAGAPLRTDDGNTICVIDREPRDSSSKKDRESLKEFAKVVMRELEL
uniref:Uncharacterized protein n=1 Tax=Rhizophagus irregularis (strain DAOM 181602 / DAOM 197198 / MUCL 43194) TaxID=747089 RepID=U9UQ05_RHIID